MHLSAAGQLGAAALAHVAQLKIWTGFSLILGTFQKCNFRTESKKLFCRIKYVKAHQVVRFARFYGLESI